MAPPAGGNHYYKVSSPSPPTKKDQKNEDKNTEFLNVSNILEIKKNKNK